MPAVLASREFWAMSVTHEASFDLTQGHGSDQETGLDIEASRMDDMLSRIRILTLTLCTITSRMFLHRCILCMTECKT